jgi:DNA-directed RNA polymerase specialized sigma subunit
VEHLQQLRSQAQRITAAYKAVPGGGGSGSGRVEITAQILQLEATIKADTKRLQDELLMVRFMINSLDDFQERIILNYRYINGKTFEAIADKTHYELRQVYRIHGRALAKLVALEERLSRMHQK